jgi:hypothetical protein
MNVIDLLARLNGEVLSNKARAVIDGKVVILARLTGEDWEYTPEGQDLANLHSNEVAAEVKAPRTRKPKEAAEPAVEPVVEETAVSEPVAVESADVAPEL